MDFLRLLQRRDTNKKAKTRDLRTWTTDFGHPKTAQTTLRKIPHYEQDRDNESMAYMTPTESPRRLLYRRMSVASIHGFDVLEEQEHQSYYSRMRANEDLRADEVLLGTRAKDDLDERDQQIRQLYKNSFTTRFHNHFTTAYRTKDFERRKVLRKKSFRKPARLVEKIVQNSLELDGRKSSESEESVASAVTMEVATPKVVDIETAERKAMAKKREQIRTMEEELRGIQDYMKESTGEELMLKSSERRATEEQEEVQRGAAEHRFPVDAEAAYGTMRQLPPQHTTMQQYSVQRALPQQMQAHQSSDQYTPPRQDSGRYVATESRVRLERSRHQVPAGTRAVDGYDSKATTPQSLDTSRVLVDAQPRKSRIPVLKASLTHSHVRPRAYDPSHIQPEVHEAHSRIEPGTCRPDPHKTLEYAPMTTRGLLDVKPVGDALRSEYAERTPVDIPHEHLSPRFYAQFQQSSPSKQDAILEQYAPRPQKTRPERYHLREIHDPTYHRDPPYEHVSAPKHALPTSHAPVETVCKPGETHLLKNDDLVKRFDSVHSKISPAPEQDLQSTWEVVEEVPQLSEVARLRRKQFSLLMQGDRSLLTVALAPQSIGRVH